MRNFLSIFGKLVPVILSFLLLAAHYSRKDQFVPVIIAIAAMGLLFIRKEWSVRTIQAFLVAGAVEWIISMLNYIVQRKSIGDDLTRLAIILSAVALFTALSGLVFFSKKLRLYYRIK